MLRPTLILILLSLAQYISAQTIVNNDVSIDIVSNQYSSPTSSPRFTQLEMIESGFLKFDSIVRDDFDPDPALVRANMKIVFEDGSDRSIYKYCYDIFGDGLYPDYLSIYKYNSENRLIAVEEHESDGNGWKIIELASYDYDDMGYEIEYEHQTWESSSPLHSSNYRYKTEKQYYKNGLIKKLEIYHWDYDISIWKLNSYDDYIYDEDRLTKLEKFEQESSGADAFYLRSFYEYHYDEQGNRTAEHSYKWLEDTEKYGMYQKTEYKYAPPNSVILGFYYINSQDSTLIPVQRREYHRNPDGLTDSIIYFNSKSIAGAFEYTDWSIIKVGYRYNEHNELICRSQSYWNHNLEIWNSNHGEDLFTDSTQLTLRNWFVDESTTEKVYGDGTNYYLAKKDLNFKETDLVSIHPNPFCESMNLVFKFKRVKGVFQLYDMNGKLVLLQTVNGNTTIETEILESGIYLYKYIEGNRIDTGKIQKL